MNCICVLVQIAILSASAGGDSPKIQLKLDSENDVILRVSDRRLTNDCPNVPPRKDPDFSGNSVYVHTLLSDGKTEVVVGTNVVNDEGKTRGYLLQREQRLLKTARIAKSKSRVAVLKVEGEQRSYFGLDLVEFPTPENVRKNICDLQYRGAKDGVVHDQSVDVLYQYFVPVDKSRVRFIEKGTAVKWNRAMFEIEPKITEFICEKFDGIEYWVMSLEVSGKLMDIKPVSYSGRFRAKVGQSVWEEIPTEKE